MDIQALTPELKEFITSSLKNEQDALTAKLTEFETKFQGQATDEMRSAVKALERRVEELGLLLNKPSDAPTVQQVKSMGQMFVDTPELKDFSKRAWSQNLRFDVPLEGNLLDRKTLIDSTAIGSSTSGILTPDRSPGIKFAGVRQLNVRDLLNVQTTESNAIEYIRENAWTNAAYPQTEGSDKAESALTFVIATASVKTVAHWIPATKQILADFRELRNAIDFRLKNGLQYKEDYDLLRGDGTTGVIGLMTGGTAFTGGYGSGNTDNRIDTVSRGMEQLDALERMATGVVLNPADWRAMNRIKDQANNVGNYVLGGPASVATPMLWGVPVAVTTAMPPGKFLVGDFANGATLYQREAMTIEVSNSHSGFFTQNKVAILAEERIALAIYRPDYFVAGQFYL